MKTLAPLVLALCLPPSCGCVIHTHGGSWFGSHASNLDHEARRETAAPLALDPGGRLSVQVPAGSVRIAAGEGPAEVRSTLLVRAATQERAEEVLAATELSIERQAEGASIVLVPPSSSSASSSPRWQVAADLDITVPPGTRLEVKTGSGKVVAAGPLGTSTLRSSYGDVSVTGVDGDLSAESGSGSVEVSDARGGEIAAKSSYGKVTLRAVEAPRIRAESGSGHVRADSVSGEAITLRTSYGNVRARDVSGRLEAKSGSGNVAIDDFRGTLEALSSYGAVECEGELSALVAHSGSGAVEVRALPGSRVDSPWKLSSGYGRVRLYVPEDFACDLDAKTAYGDIDLGLPITVDAGGLKKSSRAVSGRIGSGGGQVSLSSGSGDVSLRVLQR